MNERENVLDDMTVPIHSMALVTPKGIWCRVCGWIPESSGCRHVTSKEIKEAFRKLRRQVATRALAGNDKTAFGVLVTNLYRDVISGAARKMRPRWGDREDDFQAVVLNLLGIMRKRNGEFPPEKLEHLTQWIGRVADHSVGNVLKKETQYKARRAGKPLLMGKLSIERDEESRTKEPASGEEGLETLLCREETASLVQTALDRMQAEYGDSSSIPLRMWVLDNLEYKDIAQRLGTTFDVVRNRIDRGRKILRSMLRYKCETLYRVWLRREGERPEQGESKPC